MPELSTFPAYDPASLVGTTLDARYLIEEHIATGGMGAVFRARHVYMRKDVALKVLRPDLSASAELVERFRREAEIAASLDHDHIVKVTDFGRSPEGWLFLAMELLFGESLFDRLRRETFLPPAEAVSILRQVCDGLAAAHARGVVHRDLKPENIFLARDAGGAEVAKILDFGIAKMADPASDSATAAGMVVGTPEYLSPEQATGSAVDGRADLYTLGLIAWRALAGHHPFKADEPRALLMMQATRPVPALTDARPDLAAHPRLVAIVARACEKDPAARYQAAEEMRAELVGALDTAIVGPPPAPPPGAAERAPAASSGTIRFGGPILSPTDPALDARPVAFIRRHPRVAVLVGILLVAAGAAGATAVVLRSVREARSATAQRDAARAEEAAAVAARAATEARARPLALAREALAAGRPRDARAILEPLLPGRAAEPEVQLLLGHADQADGELARAISAWAAAQALGPLDFAALEHLAGDLARDRALADRAAALLVRAGPPAGPALSLPLASPSGTVRQRALAVARAIGPGAGVDVVGGELTLLGDPDCELRQEAARALGQLRDPRALPGLHRAAARRDEVRGLFNVLVRSTPRCGAAEAEAAARAIERR